MTRREKQIELVRRCLALAASPYPAEAEAAKQKARQLMAKYSINKAELQQVAGDICPRCGEHHPPQQPQQRRRYSTGFSIRWGNNGNWIIFTTSGANGTSTSGNW